MMKSFESQFNQQTIIKPKTLFCTDLRTCGLIIAYLELLSGVLTFAILGIVFSCEFKVEFFFEMCHLFLPT